MSVSALGIDFHVLQLRIDIDDDSGNDADYRINAVSIIYTVDT